MDNNRLFRDINHKSIAGVCAGLGIRMGIDPVWIRLLFVLFTLMGGSGILLYLLLWIIIPAGESTTEQAACSTASAGAGCASGCLIALLLLCLLPIIFIILVVAQTMGAAFTATLVPLIVVPWKALAVGGPLAISGSVLACCVLAAVAIPVVTGIIWVIKLIQGTTISGKGWATALCLWLIALLFAIISGAFALWHLPKVVDSDWPSILEQAADSIEAHMDDFDRYEPNQLPDSTSIDSSIDTSNGVLEITEEDLQNI